MLYIEQIPRTEDAPFYITDLSDIDQIRQWILQNCDITKRHVISEARRGKVIAEGIQTNLYYGWNTIGREPNKVSLGKIPAYYLGYKTFTDRESAILHYKDCKKKAEKQLAIDAELAENALEDLRKAGVNFTEWATAADDYNLESGLRVIVEVEGFCFSKNLD